MLFNPSYNTRTSASMSVHTFAFNHFKFHKYSWPFADLYRIAIYFTICVGIKRMVLGVISFQIKWSCHRSLRIDWFLAHEFVALKPNTHLCGRFQSLRHAIIGFSSCCTQQIFVIDRRNV